MPAQGLSLKDMQARGGSANLPATNPEHEGDSPMLRVILLLLSLTFAGTAPAQPWGPSGYPPQADPGAVLREGVGKLLAFAEAGEMTDPAALRAFVEREIAPYFDFAYMTRWVVGPAWRRLPPPQRAAEVARFEQRFITAMLRQIAGFGPKRVRYLPPRGEPGGQVVTLSLQVFPVQGYPTRLDFRLYRGPQGWKVFDVAANGQSALAWFRQQYRAGGPAPVAY